MTLNPFHIAFSSRYYVALRQFGSAPVQNVPITASVPDVPKVQIVPAPSLVLPRGAGEEGTRESGVDCSVARLTSSASRLLFRPNARQSPIDVFPYLLSELKRL